MAEVNWLVKATSDNVILVASGEESGVGADTAWASRFELGKEDARGLAFRILNAASETYKDKVGGPRPLGACERCVGLDYCLRNGFSDDACKSRGWQ